MNKHYLKLIPLKSTVILRFLLSILFIVSLLIPAIYTQWNIANSVSVAEKRKLSSFPPPPWQISNSTSKTWLEWPRNIDHFLEDNVGLRKKCIQSYNSFAYNILDYCAVRHVLKGKDGWLFYNPIAKRGWKRGEDPIADARATKPLSKTQIIKWVDKLQKHKAHVESWGGHFIFVIAPNKSTIYPEYLPKEYRKTYNKERPIDQIISAAKKANIDVIDLRKVIIKTKENEELYSKRDTHWNHAGAFIAAKTIMQQLHKYDSNIPVPEISDFNMPMVPLMKCDLSILTGVKGIETSQGIEYNPKSSKLYLDNSTFPTITMYHDSFGVAVKRFIEFYTPALTTFQNCRFGSRNIDEVKPDFVILLTVERFLRN